MSDLATTSEFNGQTPVIEMEAVERCFGSHCVLKDVSLSFFRGETVAIIGESGCGKSVTLKLMMSLLAPSAGRIRWFGEEVSQLNAARRAALQLRLGFLFQGAALFDSQTVGDNIAFGLRETGQGGENLETTVREHLREVGLPPDTATRFPAELSGGMKKRVGLARALALKPDVMFYDEPTTGLDPITSRHIDDLIRNVRAARNVTGIVVTHDLETVRTVADRVIMLVNRRRLEPGESQIVFNGTLDEISRCPVPIVREFIGTALTPLPSRTTAKAA